MTAINDIKELAKIHMNLLQKTEEVKKNIEERRGLAGPRGPRGPAPDTAAIVRILKSHCEEIISAMQFKDGSPGHTPTSSELLKLIKPLIPQLNLPKLAAKISVLIKPTVIKETLNMNELVDYIIKNKLLKSEHIGGFEEHLASMRHLAATKGSFHGGGDTLKAGAGQSLQKNNDGTTTLIISGVSGVEVYGESPDRSGSNFTLAHPPLAGTLRVFRGGTRQAETIDYSLVGSIFTLLNSYVSGEIILADYKY